MLYRHFLHDTSLTQVYHYLGWWTDSNRSVLYMLSFNDCSFGNYVTALSGGLTLTCQCCTFFSNDIWLRQLCHCFEWWTDRNRSVLYRFFLPIHCFSNYFTALSVGLTVIGHVMYRRFLPIFCFRNYVTALSGGLTVSVSVVQALLIQTLCLANYFTV